MMQRMKTKLRQEVWAKTKGLCFYCSQALIPDDSPAYLSMEIDHALPRAQGGTDALENLLPACSFCNCQKGNRTVEEYRSYLFSIGVVARFLCDVEKPIRDWMLLAKPSPYNPNLLADLYHPHERPMASA